MPRNNEELDVAADDLIKAIRTCVNQDLAPTIKSLDEDTKQSLYYGLRRKKASLKDVLQQIEDKAAKRSSST